MTPESFTDESSRRSRQLRLFALTALLVHCMAGAAMVLVLRHGLETNPSLIDRAQFISENAITWRLAWFAWNVSAVSMIAFVVAFVRWGRDVAGWSRLVDRTVICLCILAVLFDLSAEMILMWTLPGFAERSLGPHADEQAFDAFVSVNRLAVVLTGFLANGFYTTVAVVLAVRARWLFPGWVTVCGIGVGIAGYGLSVAAFVNSAGGMFWANVFLVPLILAWMGGVGLCAKGAARLMKVP